MRENRSYGSEGGGTELNRSSLPLSLSEASPLNYPGRRSKTSLPLADIRRPFQGEKNVADEFSRFEGVADGKPKEETYGKKRLPFMAFAHHDSIYANIFGIRQSDIARSKTALWFGWMSFV